MKEIKAGIIGGAGYTGGELIRLLVNHPHVDLQFVQSVSNAGKRLTDVHEGLYGDTDLCFSDIPYLNSIDVLFLCTAYGEARKFIESHALPDNLKIIDLSIDYRQKREGNDFVYGLPELNLEAIKSAQKIANPGCFATAIQLAVLPLAKEHLLKDEIHVNAITGSTGAGVKPGASTHFSWRENNLSVYKPFGHQHLLEIKQSLVQLQNDFDQFINFIPVRGNFTRGIFATVYTESDLNGEQLTTLYKNYYKDSAFVMVSDRNADLKQVVNTNKCLLHVECHNDKAFIVSCIDNLLKGATGQAVQNMNLMFGLDEKCGLNLKASAF